MLPRIGPLPSGDRWSLTGRALAQPTRWERHERTTVPAHHPHHGTPLRRYRPTVIADPQPWPTWLLPLLIAASLVVGMVVPRRWGWFTRAAVAGGLIVLAIELSLLLPEALDVDRYIR
jgi:hypothetical protein